MTWLSAGGCWLSAVLANLPAGRLTITAHENTACSTDPILQKTVMINNTRTRTPRRRVFPEPDLLQRRPRKAQSTLLVHAVPHAFRSINVELHQPPKMPREPPKIDFADPIGSVGSRTSYREVSHESAIRD